MLIESLSPSGNTQDSDLLNRLQALCGAERVQSGLSLRVGVCCGQGCLCQIVHTDNMVETVQLFELLRTMGYVPVDHVPGNARDAGVHRVYQHGAFLVEAA